MSLPWNYFLADIFDLAKIELLSKISYQFIIILKLIRIEWTLIKTLINFQTFQHFIFQK